MSNLYQKIPGPFLRDPETNKLREYEYTSPELEAVVNVPWQFTEKIDGTNIRIIWDGYKVSFGGRTDNAQIPPFLLAYLEEQFGGSDKETLFEQKLGDQPVVLYGEGFGPRIQKGGGNYGSEVSFALFDVVIGGLYLRRSDVEDIAAYFGVQAVPLLTFGKFEDSHVDVVDAIGAVAAGLKSQYGDFYAEGVVGVTKAGLRDRRGNRIIVKIKHRDFFAG